MAVRTASRPLGRRAVALIGAAALVGGLPVLASAYADAATSAASGFGLNSSGQLGDGTVTARRLAVALPAYGPTAVLAAGDAFSLALGTDGVVRASGSNTYGQLGDGTVTARRSPVKVTGLTGASGLAAGQTFAVAVRTDGTVAAWGRNYYGQLGDGTVTTRKTATTVPGLSGVTSVAAGDSHALAVASDGTVWAWGANAYGQLGDGTVTTRKTPVRVPGLTNVLAVAAGSAHSLALRADGTVWAWGYNAYGQLGDGTVTTRKTPVQVPGLGGVTAIAAGDHYSMALKDDRTVRSWGRNQYGQLGDGTVTTRKTPVAVTGLAGVVRIAAGDAHALAVLTAGNVRAWGLNSSGQLGDGTITTRRTSVPVKGVVNTGPLAAGTAFTVTAGLTPLVGPQPEGWWAGEDDSDSAGENPLSRSAGVLTTRGAVGCGFLLPRSATLDVPDAAVLEPGASFTFSAWLSPAATAGTQVVVAKGDATRTAWSVTVVDGKVRFTASADGTAQRAVTTSAAVLTAGRYQHVLVTYDGTLIESQRVRVYVDSVAVATDPFVALSGPPASIANLTGPTRFGSPVWSGGLDEARLYADPLTGAQVTEAYAADVDQASQPCDRSAPVTTGTLSVPANAAGWHSAPVDLTLDSDDADGTGVAELDYTVTNGTDAVDTVADGSTAVVPVTTDGTTTVTVSATDLAGNVEAPHDIVVRLDTSAPRLTAQRSPAGRNGFSTGPVTVTWDCSDTLSGVASCPAPRTVATDGKGQTVTGTATDTAGNTTATTVSSIDVDATAPTLTGSLVGVNGPWARGDVPVRWAADDATSGVDEATRPASTVLTGEGRGLTSSATVSDLAGNTTTAVSPAVSIDRTAPTTSATAPGGWSHGPVDVALTATDALSGVAATHFTVDGGAVQDGTHVRIAGDGQHTLRYWSVDVAGNAQEPVETTVLLDDAAPSISPRLSSLANKDGWYREAVTVSFVCSDTGSGLLSCSEPTTVDAEGAGQQVEGVAVDVAGNRASSQVRLDVDLTPPGVEVTARRANSDGWYGTPVEVLFSCSDALSGVATCPARSTVGEGRDQQVRGTGSDLAGNTREGVLDGLSVDLTDPIVTGSVPAEARDHWSRGDVTVTWSCDDALSGLAGPCPEPTVLTGEGTLSASATAVDRAGHTATALVSGVRIDRTAPVTTASAPAPTTSGWYTDGVAVTLTAADALSGVVSTLWSLDGSEPAVYTSPVAVTGDGAHELRYWSTDLAGNVEETGTFGLLVDKTDPTITAIASPTPAAGGWNSTAVEVVFTCADAQSGPVSCPAPVVVDREGAGQVVRGSTADAAGNTASTSVSVSLDLTAPVVTATPRTAANAAGWYTSGVEVDLSATDALSGVASTYTQLDTADAVPYTGGVTLTGDGRHVLSWWSTDVAGNVSPTGQLTVDVDATAPTITSQASPAPNAAGWNNGPVTTTFSCADTLPGKVDCSAPVLVDREGAGQVVTGTAVDAAGNRSTTTSTVSLDRTAPTVDATTSTAPGAAGWYSNGVSVAVTATDALSGLTGVYVSLDGGLAAPYSGPVVVSGDGTHTVSYWAGDVAGNVSPTGTVTVRLDATAPTITSQASPAPNAAGWNNAPVTTAFSCADTLPGEVDCSAPVLIDREGARQVVTGTAVDAAGNRSTTTSTVSLDRTAPVVTASTDGVANAAGWYTGRVAVAVTATDSLSGVAGVSLSLDGAVAVPYSGPVVVSGDGTHVVSYWAGDVAGNASPTGSVTVRVDATAPTVTSAADPVPNAASWNNTPVTTTFTCADSVPGGLTCPAPVTVDREGASQVVSGTAVDAAGNRATARSTVSLDRTAPAVTAVPTTVAGPSGWYTAPVTVGFRCADALSGVAYCPAPLTFGNGRGQAASGTAADVAGNTATAALRLDVDAVAPTVTFTDPWQYLSQFVGGQSTPVPACSASDTGSGVAGSCTVTVEHPAGVYGTWTAVATAIDVAGNVGTARRSWTVAYQLQWDAPLSSPGHDDDGVFTAKAGSTVPVSFTLQDVFGHDVTAAKAPQWLAPQPAGGAFSATTTAIPMTLSGGRYRYSWKTDKALTGTTWQIGVRLDDGTVRTRWVTLR
jgi:alpha-tubulin suppressor-like RCC1 family protein